MRNILKYVPFLVSVLTSFIVFYVLFCKLYCQIDFTKTLVSSREYIVTISGLLSGIIMAYLTSKVLQIREERISKLPQINELTQKIHRFRSIVNKLLYNGVLPSKDKEIIDRDYEKLTFYDYSESTFADSKPTQQSIDYINDKNCGGLTNLYLELRAFVPKNNGFDEALYSEFEVSTFYDTQLLEKWVKYDCGNGLWYYFDNVYADYRSKFNFNIDDRYKKDILESCLLIDRERYSGMKFDAQLLAKLGTQIHSDIIRKLFEAQLSIEKGLPKIVKYLFSIFVLLVLFGVMIPLLSDLFGFCPIWDVISISGVIGICAYIILSFYGFMKQEIKIGEIIKL